MQKDKGQGQRRPKIDFEAWQRRLSGLSVKKLVNTIILENE